MKKWGGGGEQFQMSRVQFLVDYTFTRALQLSETRGQMKRPVSTSRSPTGTCSRDGKSNRNFIHFSSGLPGSVSEVSSHYTTQLLNRFS